MDLNRVPSCPTEIQFLVLIVESHVTRGIETNDAGIDVRAAQCVIDEVVIRRIFIHATAERAIDTRVRVIMPGLSRLKSIEIDLIFARGAVVPCFSRRLLEIAAGSPRFQIRSRIAKLDRPRGRARFGQIRNWANLKPATSLTLVLTKRMNGVGPSNTSTFPNHLPGLGCNGEHAQEREHGSNQSCVHAAFLSERTSKVNLFSNDVWRAVERTTGFSKATNSDL
jgi:hypothetical protein